MTSNTGVHGETSRQEWQQLRGWLIEVVRKCQRSTRATLAFLIRANPPLSSYSACLRSQLLISNLQNEAPRSRIVWELSGHKRVARVDGARAPRVCNHKLKRKELKHDTRTRLAEVGGRWAPGFARKMEIWSILEAARRKSTQLNSEVARRERANKPTKRARYDFGSGASILVLLPFALCATNAVHSTKKQENTPRVEDSRPGERADHKYIVTLTTIVYDLGFIHISSPADYYDTYTKIRMQSERTQAATEFWMFRQLK